MIRLKDLIKKLLSPRARRRILDFLNHLWCGFCKLLPLRNRVLFYTIRANGRLLDNSRAVYDALECKKVVFARMLPHPERIKPLIYYYLLTSRVIVTDDYVRYMRAVKLRPQQKLIQIWHACGAFKKFGLDAPSRLTRQEELATHSQYTAVAVTGEECRKAFAHAFGVSEDICLPIGLPRTDRLLQNAPEMRDAVRKRHPEFRGKTVYLYCPTFREAGGKQVRYDPRIDFAALSAALGEEEIFIVRRHPIMDYELLDGEYPNILDLSGESTLELTAACDVMITDYSSVIYDACLLDVPTVFYCPDCREYERGFYLNFPDDLPGEMITDPAELLDAARRAKKDPPVGRIASFRSGQMGACDGHSAERVAELIKGYLK